MSTVEFGLLGPLVVRRDHNVIPVQRGNQRALLAALLLNANRILTVDEIAETLWGSSPPPSEQVTIRNYVKRLRHALEPALEKPGRTRISAQPRGYMITISDEELDISRFEALHEAARASAEAGAWAQAATRASAALSLWRGEPLADVESDALALKEVPRLAETRMQTLEIRVDADLHLGRHASVIAELRQLTVDHPLREHLHAQLMLALYGDGRQAEALAAYQRARQLLVAELGTEPGARLRELHQRVLNADPSLMVTAAESAVTGGPCRRGLHAPACRPARAILPRPRQARHVRH